LGNLLLKVTELNASYGDAQALWDISFQVKDGEVFSIIGSNGVGKSTTLKSISGLIHPSSGTIEFMGNRIEKKTPSHIVDLGIALVPEGRGLFSKLTVRENLELGAFTKRARPRMEGTIKELSAIFPVIDTRHNQIVGRMSGGEQQMVALARALMSRPKLLMLDEPSLGLAPLVVRKVFEIIATLKQEGVTILLVEQNVHQALRISDRAAVVRTGRIAVMGTGHQLLLDHDIHKAYMGSLR
jgi:branched-chain amino acid transport system ATP-binding protein